MARARLYGPVPRSKYKNVATEVDGIRFASKREAKRYAELKLLEKAGEIYNLNLQVKKPLHANGSIIGDYVADFEYVDRKIGEIVTEDAKGVRTPLYKWKKKHFEAEYGREIKEV